MGGGERNQVLLSGNCTVQSILVADSAFLVSERPHSEISCHRQGKLFKVGWEGSKNGHIALLWLEIAKQNVGWLKVGETVVSEVIY